MCAGTALLMVTFSEGFLQTFFAVTVQMTSTPGNTFEAGTSLVDFCPFASTTSCFTSATDLSSMQPGSAAKACEPKPQAEIATMAMNAFFPLNMCVSFTGSSWYVISWPGS